MEKEFFELLKQVRARSSYTQADIAGKLGISLQAYQNYEYKTLPPHDKLVKLNELFGVDLSRAIYQQKVGKESEAPGNSRDLAETVLRIEGILNKSAAFLERLVLGEDNKGFVVDYEEKGRALKKTKSSRRDKSHSERS